MTAMRTFLLLPTGALILCLWASIIALLTPNPKSSYYVRIRIDLLFNYFKPVPKRGDVIVVSGRVTSRQDYPLDMTTKEVPINC